MKDIRGENLSLESVKSCVGKGWGKLLEDLVSDLEKLGWDGNVYQVKEKFGGLRFYIEAGTDEIYSRIGKAEEESYTICEFCGKPGKVRKRAWIKTLCSKCNKKKELV